MKHHLDTLTTRFNDFKTATPKERKHQLPAIEAACASLQAQGVSPYADQCCTRFLEACRKMARQRQPQDYDDSALISRALGDLSLIESNLGK